MKIAHVTLYSQKGEKHVKGSGVASYSKNLVTHIAAMHNDQTVICNTIDGRREEYVEDKVLVHRVFERKPSFLIAVHKKLKEVDPDVVHVQQELALYGNIITAYLLQWLVFLWRKKVVITLHGVVDPKAVNAEFVKENNSRLPVWLVQLGFRVIYTPLMRWANKVIVHEQHFKDIAVASYGVRPDKVEVVPHGIEILESMDEQQARTTLSLPGNAKVALFMGYATGYKGLDLLIEGFGEYAKNHSDAYLIIGAGKHPKLSKDKQYLEEYDRLQAKASKLIPERQYRWEGFIDEREIVTYYSASNVSLYPYTTALSSSGPMSFAIGYEKPFLVSTAFERIFQESPQLLFERTGRALADRLEYFFSHQEEYAAVSANLKAKRNWTNVGARTLQLYKQTHDQERVYETEKSTTTR